MREKLELLQNEELKLDQSLLDAKKIFDNVTENQTFKDYGYVTFDDIKSLSNGNDINLIAVKAPSGTSLEIPDPDQISKIYNETKKVKFLQ